ncbi:MAG: hypothetical protein ACKVRP_11085 [Bacteroidota bacterium]
MQSFIKDTLSVSQHDSKARVSEIESSVFMAFSDQRMQARGFFATIFVGIVGAMVAFFTQPQRKHFGILAIIFSGIMLFHDIHMMDLLERQSLHGLAIRNTINRLVTYTPTDSTMLTMFIPSGPEHLDSLTLSKLGDPRPICRKISKAVQPNTEQEIFYFVPLMGLLALLWYSDRKERK